jgi:hypothetical protein
MLYNFALWYSLDSESVRERLIETLLFFAADPHPRMLRREPQAVEQVLDRI